MKTSGPESVVTSAPAVSLQGELNVAQHVLNAAPVIVLLLDPQGVIQQVNPFFEQLTGWRLDEIKGKDWFTTFIPVRDQDRIRSLFKIAIGGSPTRGNVNPIVTRTGEEREIEWNDQVMRDADGQVTSILAIGMDVTERKRAEQREAVRSSQFKNLSELGLLLAGSPDLVFARIVRLIGEQFQVRVVCLSQIERDELRFQAVYVNGEVMTEAGHCQLKMTPCATVQEAKDLRIYDRVAERFPEASFLRAHNAYAYCGFPCLDKAGSVVAVICVLDDKPRDFTEEEQHLLRIIGQRVATEIEHARVADEQKRAVQALRESERRTRQILDGLFGFVGVFSLDGTLIDVNEAPLQRAGLSREEVLGRPFWDTYWWNYDERVQEELKSVFLKAARGEVVRYEPNVRMQGGALITIDVTFGPLRNSAGEITDILGFAVDITDRKRAELALQENEERLRLSLSAAGQGFWDLDLTTGNAVFSPEYATMIGFDPANFQETNAKWAERLHPDDREKVYGTFEAYVRGEIPRYEVEFRQRTRNGGWLWTLSIGSTTARDAAGKPLRMHGTHTNIHARKVAEEALRVSEERFQQMAANVDAVLWVAEPSSMKIEFVSSAFERIWGWPVAELLEHSSLWLDAIIPEDRARVAAAFQLLGSENSTIQEYRIHRKDGELRIIRDRGFVSRDSHGRVIRLIGIAEDVTVIRTAEQAIRESEARYQRAERGVNDGLWEWDVVTGAAYYSPRLLEMLGYSAADFPTHSDTFKSLIHPHDAARLQVVFDKCVRHSEPFDEEFRMRCKSGEYIWVRFRGSIERNMAGDSWIMSGSITDITKRKRLEEQRRKSESLLNEAQRIANIGSWELDLTTSQLTWSDEIYRIFEIDPARFEASYEAFLYTIHPEDREMVNAAYTQSLKTREPYDIVHRLQMADGRIKFVRERCETFYDNDKRPLRSLGTVQDVTQLQVAEEKLRASETRYRMLVEQATDGIFLHRADGSVLDVNRQACESLGFSRDELIGMKVAEFDPFITPEELQEIQSQLDQGQAVTFESYHRRKDGSKFPVEIRINPFHIANEPVGLAVVRDITERKQAGVQLQELRDLLAHMNRLGTLGEIASGLAHELNQPLGAINIDASTSLFLSKEIDSPKLQSCLQRISDQALRAGEIVRRMRSFIRRDSFKKEPHEINRLIREVLMLLDDRLRHNSVRLELSLAESLPAIAVDGIQIQQVLVNLVRNADDAMAENGDTPRVLTIRTEAASGAIRIEIADTGCGLDPEIAAKLFFPFQTTKPSGLGLGLVICHTIVDAHDGRIEARSNPVRGTTFTLTLPVIS